MAEAKVYTVKVHQLRVQRAMDVDGHLESLLYSASVQGRLSFLYNHSRNSHRHSQMCVPMVSES